MEAYEQSSNTESAEAAEQFQSVLDGDADFIEGIIDKILELKVLKDLQFTIHSPEVASIWSQPSLGPMKPPCVDISPFSRNVLWWQDIWNAFDVSVHRAKCVPVDKLNYLEST